MDGLGMDAGANMKNETIAMMMQIMHMKTDPPIKMPIHAMGWPDSFCLRIRFNEIIPDISARTPKRKLTGKQMKPVNGIGIEPMQKNRIVRIPNTRLRMDNELMGADGFGSFVSMIIKNKTVLPKERFFINCRGERI
jgi:hypothetical protein